MAIIAAIVTSGLFVVIVLGSLVYNHRLWIQDFPQPIQEQMDPLSRNERMVQASLAVLLILVVIGIPLLSVLRIKSIHGDISGLDGALHLWLIFMAVNLVDLVFIDWVIGIWWQPESLSSPEIEQLRQHNTYRFHIVEHLKGTLLLTVVALVLGGLVSVA